MLIIIQTLHCKNYSYNVRFGFSKIKPLICTICGSKPNTTGK